MKKHNRADLEQREAEDRQLVGRLLAAGCPVPCEPEPAGQSDLMFEVLRPLENTVLEVRYRGGTEYIFYGRISNNSYRHLEMFDLRCRLPWEDPYLTWLPPYPSQPEHYRQLGGRTFPRESVMNHRLGEGLGPGASVEGFLLACSMDTLIPDDFPHGTQVPVEIEIVDQFGRSNTSTLECHVDRSERLVKSRAQRSEPHVSLFAQDPKISGSGEGADLESLSRTLNKMERRRQRPPSTLNL